jgi:hypothetical protein
MMARWFKRAILSMMSEERRRRFYRNRIRRIRRDMASLGFTTTMTDDKLEAALFLVTQTRRVFSERRQEVNANTKRIRDFAAGPHCAPEFRDALVDIADGLDKLNARLLRMGLLEEQKPSAETPPTPPDGQRKKPYNPNDYFDDFIAWVRMGHRARASAIVPERRHEHPTEEPDGAYVVPGMRVTFNTNGSDRTVAPSGWNSHQRDGEISVWSDSGTSYNGTASLYTYQGRKVLGYERE